VSALRCFLPLCLTPLSCASQYHLSSGTLSQATDGVIAEEKDIPGPYSIMCHIITCCSPPYWLVPWFSFSIFVQVNCDCSFHLNILFMLLCKLTPFPYPLCCRNKGKILCKEMAPKWRVKKKFRYGVGLTYSAMILLYFMHL